MLNGHDIVYYAPGKWDELWRDRHEIATILAQQNKVVFVERRPHLRPTLAAFSRGEFDLSDLSKPLVRCISKSLFVFHYPIWAPKSGRFPISWFNRLVRRRSLQRTLESLQVSRPIVFFSRPSMVLDSIDEMPTARLRVYHIVDEYTGYGQLSSAKRRRIRKQEREMLHQADVVLTVSKKLYDAKSPFNAHTYLVPNGVNYRAYADALDDPSLPHELQAIPRPRLGYSGLISQKVDLEMLKSLAQEHTEWSFVFVGEVRLNEQMETWQALLAMPNVYYLGLVDISQVPHYVKGFDVGLMPYVLNRQVENSCPLKLYDYLAAGIPIASVDVPAVREYAPYIHLAENRRDFDRAIRNALADTAPERRLERRKTAAHSSWEARVEQISIAIENHLEKKPAVNSSVEVG